MSNFFRTTESAVTELRRLRPDLTIAAEKRNAGRIKAHLSRDYTDSRGLLVLGHKGCRTKNFIEFYDNEERGTTDVEYLIAVEIDRQWEVFDSHELCVSNEFIVGEGVLTKRKEEVKQQHLQEKRDENYDQQV